MGIKRNAGLALLACSVLALIYLLRARGQGERLSAYMTDAKSFARIMEDRAASQELKAEEIIMNETGLFLDSGSDTFYYSLPEGDSSVMDPYTEFQCSDPEAKAAVLETEITEQSIRENQSVQLLIYNRDSYHLYRLKCTTLPLLQITCGGEITEEAGRMRMEMELLDNRAETAASLIRSEGTIRIRGNSTRKYEKKGFRLSLTRESTGGNTRSNMISLLGMRQDDDWLLYAAYNDQEKIRNVFSSNLWKASCGQNNELGLDLGAEYRYVELFLNGEYRGLYALGYPVDGKMAAIDQQAGEYLYKKIDWANSIDLRLDETGNLSGYEISEGLWNSGRWDALLKLHGLFSGEEADSGALYASVDISNVIDNYIFLNLIQGMDHVSESSLKNIYLAAKNTDDGQKILYIPWDMDLTWGNKWQYVSQNYTLSYETPPQTHYIMESGVIYRLLGNRDGQICQMIVNRYRELREGLWSDQSVSEMLDGYEKEIYGSGAFLRDRERWPDGTYGDPEEGLSRFRAFVLERLSCTDRYYDTLETLQGKGTYVIRTAQYEDFHDSRFLIEIHNHQLTEDRDVRELLEFMGVDPDRIGEETVYIAVNGQTGEVDYIGGLTVGDCVDSCIGELALYADPQAEYSHPEDYDVLVNAEGCFRCQPSAPEEIRMKVLTEEGMRDFRFKK